jgi:hypothetical protein
MNNGSITNTALASGTDPNGDPVTDDSDTGTDPDGNTIDNPELVDSDGDGDPGNDPTVTNLNQDPQISLVKSASVGGTGNCRRPDHLHLHGDQHGQRDGERPGHQ